MALQPYNKGESLRGSPDKGSRQLVAKGAEGAFQTVATGSPQAEVAKTNTCKNNKQTFQQLLLQVPPLSSATAHYLQPSQTRLSKMLTSQSTNRIALLAHFVLFFFHTLQTANKLPLAVSHFVYSYIWRRASHGNGLSIGSGPRGPGTDPHVVYISPNGELLGYLAAGITNNIL